MNPTGYNDPKFMGDDYGQGGYPGMGVHTPSDYYNQSAAAAGAAAAVQYSPYGMAAGAGSHAASLAAYGAAAARSQADPMGAYGGYYQQACFWSTSHAVD